MTWVFKHIRLVMAVMLVGFSLFIYSEVTRPAPEDVPLLKDLELCDFLTSSLDNFRLRGDGDRIALAEKVLDMAMDRSVAFHAPAERMLDAERDGDVHLATIERIEIGNLCVGISERLSG